MSTLKTNNVQVGQSVTATNNFTLYQPSSPDGTVRLGVGNSGATSADVLVANSSSAVMIGTATQSTGATLTVNGSIKGTITSGTTIASTSGTAIEFTGIPSWVKRITVMYSGVSLSGTSNPIIQLGSTTYTTSGYLGSASTGAGTAANMSAGFIISNATAAADTAHGMSTLATLNGLIWAFTSTITYSNQAATRYSSGSITMPGTVDRLRIQATNGTDTFDAGNINILYEG
jgi:hypothetical protein